jgi:hypothetical protein
MTGSLRLEFSLFLSLQISGDHHANSRFQSAERVAMARDQEIAASPISDMSSPG